MDAVTIFLRLLHVFGGVFWAGTNLALAFFIMPTVSAAGAEGGRFIERLMGARRLSLFMNLAAPITTLSGLLLYWRASGFQLAWITTNSGLGFTIGGLAGIATFFLGILLMSPTALGISTLGKELATAGGPPAPEKLARMQTLQNRLRVGGMWDASLMILAIVLMAVARYL
jgi:uncharacterized membrane protein